MDEEKRSWRWLWAAVPAVVAVVALAIALSVFRPTTNKLPDHLVNISGTIRSAQPVEELVDATMSMEERERSAVLAEPEKWQGYELTLRLTDKCTGFNGKLSSYEWFVNPGIRYIETKDGFQYEKLPDDPTLIVGPYHGEQPCNLNKGTDDYKVNLVVNKEGKTPEEIQQYIDNITIDVQTTVLWKDKEVDYVMTPITWAK